MAPSNHAPRRPAPSPSVTLRIGKTGRLDSHRRQGVQAQRVGIEELLGRARRGARQDLERLGDGAREVVVGVGVVRGPDQGALANRKFKRPGCAPEEALRSSSGEIGNCLGPVGGQQASARPYRRPTASQGWRWRRGMAGGCSATAARADGSFWSAVVSLALAVPTRIERNVSLRDSEAALLGWERSVSTS